MTCEEFEEISGAYVLDAVTPAERQAAEEHLATCTKCRSRERELRNVAALLPLAAPQVNPPEALKERVMAAIQQESGQPQQPERPPGAPLPLRRRQPRWSARVLAVAAVLALALLGGMTAWNVGLQRQVTTLQSQVATVAAANSTTTYTITGTQSAPGAMGQLVYFPQQHVTVLFVRGLPQLQGMHVYQGWLLHLKNGQPTSVASIGLLNIQNGVATLSFFGNLSGYDAAAISLERGPTATPNAPQGKVVAQGSLAHSA